MVMTQVGGSRGLLAHAELWQQLWTGWLLLGDSVSIQWVPSRIGVEGNERADLHTRHRAKAAKHAVTAHKSATDIWADLGLQEIPDTYASDSNVLGGSCLSTDSESFSESENK